MTCTCYYFLILLAAIWITPDILSVIGRALGGIGRLIKRHPAISLISIWIVLMMVAQQAAHQ